MPRPPGQVLFPNPVPKLATLNRFDPRAAMSQVLASYMRCAEFVRWGAEGEDVSFKLNEVLEEWPSATHIANTPSASIIDATPTGLEASAFTPQPLEDSFNVYGEGTVLWKMHEAVQSFQIDVWTTNVGDREAIAAGLPGLFSPGESRSGVVLSGSPVYFCMPVRATLISYQRMDSPNPVHESERRLMVRVQCEMDAVELRTATDTSLSVYVNAWECLEINSNDEPSTKLAHGCDGSSNTGGC